MENRDIKNLIDKTLAYKEVVENYFRLASKLELSDEDADQLAEILLKAESDEILYFLIDEVDQTSFESVEISRDIEFQNLISNLESPLRGNYIETVTKDYYRLASKEVLSILEQERLDEILDVAESDSIIGLLVNEIDELTFYKLGFLEAQQSLDNEIQKHDARMIVGLPNTVDDDEINIATVQIQQLEDSILRERIHSQQLEQQLLIEKDNARKLEQQILKEKDNALKI